MRRWRLTVRKKEISNVFSRFLRREEARFRGGFLPILVFLGKSGAYTFNYRQVPGDSFPELLFSGLNAIDDVRFEWPESCAGFCDEEKSCESDLSRRVSRISLHTRRTGHHI